MNKKSLILFVLISLFALSLSMYQYVKEFRSNFVGAYSTVKPANGHLWSEMECSSSLCVIGGKLGVGTDNPTDKLTVSDSSSDRTSMKIGDTSNSSHSGIAFVNDKTPYLSWIFAAGSNYSSFGGPGSLNLYNGGTGPIALSNGGVLRMSVLNNGNVGIGTANPTKKLEVKGDYSDMYFDPASSGPVIGTTFGSGANIELYNGSTGRMTFSNGFGSGFVFSGGNVGIGVNAPTKKLEVSGDVLASGDICNAAGACLSQLNSFIGSQPLVNNVHNYSACTSAGGTIVATAGSYKQCRFNSSTCPSGWTNYLNWSTTTAQSYIGGTGCSGCWNGCAVPSSACQINCTASGHAWADIAQESCAYRLGAYCNTTAQCLYGSGIDQTGYSIKTQIGCY